jgi:hypothetical protein
MLGITFWATLIQMHYLPLFPTAETTVEPQNLSGHDGGTIVSIPSGNQAAIEILTYTLYFCLANWFQCEQHTILNINKTDL